VMDISKLLDTKYELRAGVDIFLAYTSTEDDVPGEIQKVSYEGSINEVTFDETVDITA
jgi:hypothetical protein